MDLVSWSIAALSLLLGCWVQTALGFGMAVVAAPVIVLVNPAWVPVVLTMNALAISAINAWNYRASLQYREMALPMLARLPGTVLGAWLLLQMNASMLQLLVASCVLAAVVLTWLAPRFRATPSRVALASLVSGVTGTTTSIGGPPMALLWQHLQADTARANLSCYFTFSCVMSLLAYGLAGLLDLPLLLHGLSFLPCALLGFSTGQRARRFVDAGRFRPLLLGLCVISALVALYGLIPWQ